MQYTDARWHVATYTQQARGADVEREDLLGTQAGHVGI